MASITGNDTDAQFDFLVDEPEPTSPLAPTRRHRGPHAGASTKMTPKRLAQATMEAFEELGGVAWLVENAKADPKTFMNMISKILPRNLNLDGVDQVQVNIVNMAGEKLNIDKDGNAFIPKEYREGVVGATGQDFDDVDPNNINRNVQTVVPVIEIETLEGVLDD